MYFLHFLYFGQSLRHKNFKLIFWEENENILYLQANSDDICLSLLYHLEIFISPRFTATSV